MFKLWNGLAIDVSDIRKIRVGFNRTSDWSLILNYKNGDSEVIKVDSKEQAYRLFEGVINYGK